MSFVQESPIGQFRIECIVPFSRGFLIAGDNGLVIPFERTEDPRNPYRRLTPMETKIDPN
jgi:hypothetical protein